MSIGKRSTDDAPAWRKGETGSAIGRPLRTGDDDVRPKDMAEILDEGFGENQAPSIDNQMPRTIPPQFRDKQSWTKRLFQAIQRCFSCKKMNLVSIATAMCAVQLQAYQTATVDGIVWKYEVSGGGCKLYGSGDTVYNTPTATTIPQDTSGDIIIPEKLNGLPVTSIMNFAFANCTKITSVIIPDSVTTIGQSAFYLCGNLEKVVFGKSVTSIGNTALWVKKNNTSTSTKLKTIVIKGKYFEGYNGATSIILASGTISVYVSTQWTLPKKWFGYNAQYYDPIPAIGSAVAKNLYEALYDAEDERLKSIITTEAQYNNFRSWANGVIGTSNMAQRQTVKDSSFAWLSYALDADSLITKAPVQGELSIGRFTPNADETKAFDLDVAIDGISIGANATAANLAEVFNVEGSTSPNGTYSSNDVEVSFGTPSEGKVKCTARPKDTTKTSFFMRVKMNP